MLSDGGSFDNLGVTALEPGKSSKISTNVVNIDYLICCDAGTGLYDGTGYPNKLRGRLTGSYETSFRKVQDGTRKRLHMLNEFDQLTRFVMAYLGQKDSALPWIPTGLPLLPKVRNYPTDFKSMTESDIDCLARRGEILMRFLVSYYLPEL